MLRNVLYLPSLLIPVVDELLDIVCAEAKHLQFGKTTTERCMLLISSQARSYHDKGTAIFFGQAINCLRYTSVVHLSFFTAGSYQSFIQAIQQHQCVTIC